MFRGEIGDYKDKLREIMSLPRSADKNFGGEGESKSSGGGNKKKLAPKKAAGSAAPVTKSRWQRASGGGRSLADL